jgi:carbonic anhydrase
VPPELVFDQGLGDLFVIRVAGEVAPAEVIGSIEYAVEHLGCRAVIVLGHERCGAVEAALKGSSGNDPAGEPGRTDQGHPAGD